MARLARETFWGEPLLIEHGDAILHANLHLPPGLAAGARQPAVVLVHGLSGNRNEAFGLFIKTAAALALKGIVALRVDCRGSGETGGSTLEISLHSLGDDVRRALDFLRRHDLVDAGRVGLLGLSMGGLVAAHLAGTGEDLAAICLWEAPADLMEVMNRTLGPYTVKSVRTKGYVQVGFIQLGPGFFDAVEGLDMATVVASYNRPVLIVQGTHDLIVPVQTAEQWRRFFAGTEPEVFLVEGADHAFTRDCWSWPAIHKSAGWFAQTFNI